MIKILTFTDSVLLFDNIDDVLEKDGERFLGFFQQLLQKLTSIPRENNVRTVIYLIFI
jgi:hypothetical protein